MNFLSDNSLLLMEKSMGFLWTKQAAILDNIANVETPNYKAKLVTFEDSLRAKLESAAASRNPRGQVRSVLESSQFAVTEPQEAARMDENGVNLIEQSTELARNAYQLQYVQNAISSELALLRTAIRGQ